MLRASIMSITPALLGAAAIAWTVGCSSGEPKGRGEPPPMQAAAAGSTGQSNPNMIPAAPPWMPPVCPVDNPFCAGKTGTQTPTAGDCGNAPIDLKPQGVNVMIAVDGSASMVAFWPEVQNAVRRLFSQNPGGQFGVHMFYGLAPEDWDAVVEKSNLCGKTQNQVLDVDMRTEAELVAFLGDAPPAPAGFLPSSPLVEPINYYLENATKLADPTRTNYLVIISDGEDNCFGSAFTNPADKRLALEKVATELASQNIRLVPIGFVPSADNGMPMDEAAAARLEALDTLAKFGGAGIGQAFKAEKPEDLLAAIDQVGSAVGNCRFSIPATLDPTMSLNPFELSFTLNGIAVDRDRLNANGWNFTRRQYRRSRVLRAVVPGDPKRRRNRGAQDVPDRSLRNRRGRSPMIIPVVVEV